MKKNIFTLVAAILVASIMYGAWSLAKKYINGGEDINKKAWESSYRERKLPVPASGPREGYWGARLGGKVRDGRLGWHEPEIHLNGLVDIDSRGWQFYRSEGKIKHRIMIVGGSVASGANASGIGTTYFNILGNELDRRGLPVEIIVVAAGAWKSIQELNALRDSIKEIRPELVVFLNGLNDLTNGSTSRTLFGEETPTSDGSPWTVLYHAHDYEQRVTDYLDHMASAQKITAANGSKLLIVLQPSLNERTSLTSIENELLESSLDSKAVSAALTASYKKMSLALKQMAQAKHFNFIDCSRVFDSEKQTVFTDIWHFTDFGHRDLGRIMAVEVAKIISGNPE